MTRPPVVLLGAGGHAKVIVATLSAAGREIAAVLDDDPARRGARLLGFEVAGPVDRLAELAAALGAEAIAAVGDNRSRQRLVRRVEEAVPGVAWASAVHPRATVHESVRVAPGAVVFAGAVVQPEGALGAHAIVNTGATLDHDGRLGDFAHLAPGAHLAGGVAVGEGALVGVGAVVLPGRSIGRWAVVGAGATVTRDVPDGSTVAGTAARPLPAREG